MVQPAARAAWTASMEVSSMLVLSMHSFTASCNFPPGLVNSFWKMREKEAKRSNLSGAHTGKLSEHLKKWQPELSAPRYDDSSRTYLIFDHYKGRLFRFEGREGSSFGGIRHFAACGKGITTSDSRNEGGRWRKENTASEEKRKQASKHGAFDYSSRSSKARKCLSPY